jgi:HTH-type transcriptional regulator / antitoxin HigA
MPIATYEELLVETVPQVIKNDKHYREVAALFGDLLGKGRSRTRDETRLMRLLALLIEDYDRRNALPHEDNTPAEILSFLMEHSGKKPTDLLPIFGQRSHVNEALTGKRTISAGQARKLGRLFSVKPGLFL